MPVPVDDAQQSFEEHQQAIHASVMASVVATARDAWPTIDLAVDRFTAHLADRLPRDVDLETALRRTHTSDLYLACACMHGDPDALAAFDLNYLTLIDRALPRIGLGADAVSEVKQRLRRQLLVADDGPPGIAGFTGRGRLRSWVRVMAVHEALAITRQARRHVASDEDRLVNLVAAGASPEIEYFKRVYRHEFAVAFREAIQSLSDRERTLIRQHFLDGVNVHRLARLHGVHRVTAGRWLEQARTALLSATRTHMMDRLDVPPAEVESILRLVLSQLELNLRALFRQPAR